MVFDNRHNVLIPALSLMALMALVAFVVSPAVADQSEELAKKLANYVSEITENGIPYILRQGTGPG